MFVAMMLGMCVLGMAFRAIHIAVFGTGFEDAWERHVELTSLAMAFNMTLPMVAWMRYRGHEWGRCAEMAAAMFVPTLALLVLSWAGAIAARAVLPVAMVLMLPSMIAVMLYRLDAYVGHHPARATAQAEARRWSQDLTVLDRPPEGSPSDAPAPSTALPLGRPASSTYCPEREPPVAGLPSAPAAGRIPARLSEVTRDPTARNLSRG